jgi:hypothetical protein
LSGVRSRCCRRWSWWMYLWRSAPKVHPTTQIVLSSRPLAWRPGRPAAETRLPSTHSWGLTEGVMVRRDGA